MLRVSPKIAQLFQMLLKQWPRVLKNETIINELWDYAWDGPDVPNNIIKVYVCKLRKFMHLIGGDIKVSWGNGYELILPGQYQPRIESSYQIFNRPGERQIKEWTQDDEQRMIAMQERGWDTSLMAKALMRTEHAVQNRLRKVRAIAGAVAIGSMMLYSIAVSSPDYLICGPSYCVDDNGNRLVAS